MTSKSALYTLVCSSCRSLQHVSKSHPACRREKRARHTIQDWHVHPSRTATSRNTTYRGWSRVKRVAMVCADAPRMARHGNPSSSTHAVPTTVFEIRDTLRFMRSNIASLRLLVSAPLFCVLSFHQLFGITCHYTTCHCVVPARDEVVHSRHDKSLSDTHH